MCHDDTGFKEDKYLNHKRVTTELSRMGGFVAFWVVVVVLLAASFWLWW